MFGPGGISIWQLLVILIVLIPLLLLPTIIAAMRDHPHKVPIILVNILGGLVFGLGWVVALVWCFIQPRPAESISSTDGSVAYELEKLYGLKEEGAISEQEYESKKRQLLADS